MPRITRIQAFQVDLPLHEGSYKWSGGKSVEVFDSTIVRVETDEGVTGHGEVCPLGPFYLPAYAGGVRSGLAELAPHLIGAEATRTCGYDETDRVSVRMLRHYDSIGLLRNNLVCLPVGTMLTAGAGPARYLLRDR